MYRQQKTIDMLTELLETKGVLSNIEGAKLRCASTAGLAPLSIADEDSPFSTSDINIIKNILNKL